MTLREINHIASREKRVETRRGKRRRWRWGGRYSLNSSVNEMESSLHAEEDQ